MDVKVIFVFTCFLAIIGTSYCNPYANPEPQPGISEWWRKVKPSIQNFGRQVGLAVSRPVCKVVSKACKNVPTRDYADPLDDYADPVVIYSNPIDDFAGPINDYADPINDFADPINDYADPINDYADPLNGYADPINFYADPANDGVIVLQDPADDFF